MSPVYPRAILGDADNRQLFCGHTLSDKQLSCPSQDGDIASAPAHFVP